jgi:hypothetical protein
MGSVIQVRTAEQMSLGVLPSPTPYQGPGFGWKRYDKAYG